MLHGFANGIRECRMPRWEALSDPNGIRASVERFRHRFGVFLILSWHRFGLRELADFTSGRMLLSDPICGGIAGTTRPRARRWLLTS